MTGIFKTFIEDMRTLGMIVKISISPVDKNPIVLASREKQKREDIKRKKIEDTEKRITENYRKALAEDGDDEDEIYEQIVVSREFLHKKAKVLCYDFSGKDEQLTPIEESVERAYERLFDPKFLIRMMMYPFLTVGIIMMIVRAIETFL